MFQNMSLESKNEVQVVFNPKLRKIIRKDGIRTHGVKLLFTQRFSRSSL